MNINFKRLAIALGISLLGGNANAQLVQQSDAPIDITGDNAEFQDKIAVWTGNVRVVQAEAILTTDRLEAELSDAGDFEKIRAIGEVRYSNGVEAISGDRALFDERERTITMLDNVIVTQGKQVLAAGKVIYWIDTGKIRFTPAKGKRIRGLFFTDGDAPAL